MDSLTFNFRGKEYQALVLANTSTRPHFYWCYFVDEQLKVKIGCITFKASGKELSSTNFISKQFLPLLENLKLSLKKFIELNERKSSR